MQKQLSRIAEFELVAELGRGTTGVVYEAWQPHLNRRNAIKMPVFSPDVERRLKVDRFMHECRVLAALTSKPGSGIPALNMLSEYEGQIFSVREFVEGHSLEQRAAQGTLDLRTGLGIIASIANIIHRVHGQGFVHRNLSPANVLVATNGEPRLIGFGRVGLLAGSELLSSGSPGVSPEIDIRGLQELLEWLCESLGHAVPCALDHIWQSGMVTSPGVLAQAVRGYLLEAMA